MDIFEQGHIINNYLCIGDETEARKELIKLLDYCAKTQTEYTSFINNFIRQLGLYPYPQNKNALWTDRFASEAFKIDCGYDEPITLHREQSFVLKRLLDGKDIIVSAPTSFGKSFIIDAFISIKKPKNVVIIPTIALTDETRRRICNKFSDQYKIITTSEAVLDEKNILIFPQERTINYIGILKSIDILIIDEFYKISSNFGDNRTAFLYKLILELSKIAKQKYYLAPNIKSIEDKFITRGMNFVDKLNFNTVIFRRI